MCSIHAQNCACLNGTGFQYINYNNTYECSKLPNLLVLPHLPCLVNEVPTCLPANDETALPIYPPDNTQLAKWSCSVARNSSMPSAVLYHQYGQALLDSVRDGSYPESEEVISAELPPAAITGILNQLEQTRNSIKVCAGSGIYTTR